jgi:cytochrome c biogenesis protein
MFINKASENAANNMVWYQSVGSRIWAFFSSLKLALFILITLAVVSIIGTVIQQNQPVVFYVREYGEKWARFIFMGELNDMYHSPWFQGLLLLLIINIIVCTIKRFPPKWKSTLEVKDNIAPRFIKNLSCNESLYLSGDFTEIKGKVTEVLKKKRYKVRELKSNEGEQIYATKGITGRFGSDMVHVALLMIILGAIIGSVWGFRDFVVTYVGSSVSVPRSDLDLKLENFWIDYYETGQIKQYNSILTVIDKGNEVVKDKHIWVNRPLEYEGLTFYQSSWGVAWDRIKDAQLVLKEADSDNSGTSFIVKWNELRDIPDSKYSVKLIGYVADFAYDRNSKTVFSRSGDPENPAVNVEIYNNKNLISKPWIFLNYPGLFSKLPDSNYDLILSNYRGIYYSGLSINKDPGTGIVWAGSSLMVIGFFFAFFVFHKRIWVIINRNEDNSSTELLIGGMINKNRFTFAREFSKLVNSIKKEI